MYIMHMYVYTSMHIYLLSLSTIVIDIVAKSGLDVYAHNVRISFLSMFVGIYICTTARFYVYCTQHKVRL